MNLSVWDNAPLTHSHNTHKEKEAEELQKRIDKYLAEGGKITVIGKGSEFVKLGFNGLSMEGEKKKPMKQFVFSENKPGLQ
jgi:hypothetical protein